MGHEPLHHKKHRRPSGRSRRPTLRRALGPYNLTALGIGSVIGTGIFVLTGTAASQNAGPALVLSMIIAAVACALAGLCYAELASMIPWPGARTPTPMPRRGVRRLDHRVGSDTRVCAERVDRRGRLVRLFVSFLRDLGVELPHALTMAPGACGGVFNLPATAVVLLVTALLVIGIRQSANTNTALVVIKTAVLIVFVALGAAYVRRENLVPFIPPNTGEFGHFGWSGVSAGRR